MSADPDTISIVVNLRGHGPSISAIETPRTLVEEPYHLLARVGEDWLLHRHGRHPLAVRRAPGAVP